MKENFRGQVDKALERAKARIKRDADEVKRTGKKVSFLEKGQKWNKTDGGGYSNN